MTNYQKWVQEKRLSQYSAEKFLEWIEARAVGYGDVRELEYGLYNMFWPIFGDEVRAELIALLSAKGITP